MRGPDQIPSADNVAGPATPVARIPMRCWSLRTAVTVVGPNWPGANEGVPASEQRPFEAGDVRSGVALAQGAPDRAAPDGAAAVVAMTVAVWTDSSAVAGAVFGCDFGGAVAGAVVAVVVGATAVVVGARGRRRGRGLGRGGRRRGRRGRRRARRESTHPHRRRRARRARTGSGPAWPRATARRPPPGPEVVRRWRRRDPTWRERVVRRAGRDPSGCGGSGRAAQVEVQDALVLDDRTHASGPSEVGQRRGGVPRSR